MSFARVLLAVGIGAMCAASCLSAQPAPSAASAAGPGTRLTAAQPWTAPVGRAVAEAGALALRGEPGVEQAVVLWQGLSLDAAAIGHATVVHDGFAPNHQLSFFFRGSDGERVVDFPRTSRRATIALTSADGWHGTIFEVGLVYGPAGNVPTLLEDNTLRVHALELEAPSAGTRARAALTRLAQIAPRVGSDINVLPGALVAIAGAALLLGLVGAAATRARTRHAMLALALFAFALAELAIWRQWLVSHRDASAIAAARRASNRPIEFDWELVGIASRIREALGPESSRVAFLLAFEDPYVADRLKFHLLPLRAWRGQGIAPDPDRCLFVLTDRDTPAPLLREDTAFGPVALATLADAPPECRWNTLPSSR